MLIIQATRDRLVAIFRKKHFGADFGALALLLLKNTAGNTISTNSKLQNALKSFLWFCFEGNDFEDV